MIYYAFIKDNKINGMGECRCVSEGVTNKEITQEQHDLIELKGNNYFLVEDGELVVNPNYEEEEAAKKRAKLDKLTLTPADVERALYKAKSMNFDDLIEMIEEQTTGIDMKALKIEFRASLFYRGAKFGNGRLFDIVGGMLGYTPDDIDYLFLYKELPEK